MKKVISAHVVQQAHKDGRKEISISKNDTIITDEARSLAKKLGIKFTEIVAIVAENIPSNIKPIMVDEKLVRQVVEKVMEKLPPEKRQAEVVKDVVVDVLSKYLQKF